MKERHLFSSESVTEGHPDKVCDQVSDAILDAVMENDPYGRVACETLVTTGLTLVSGEITTSCYVDIPKTVRGVIRDIGYTNAAYGFDYNTCSVLTSIDEQSADIALGVDRAGAGDQGIMFGYACKETEEYMPLPIMLAHKICRRLSQVRKEGILSYLRPDGKSQVTVEYENNKPIRVDTVVVSSQHDPDVDKEQIERDVIEHVIKPVVPDRFLDPSSVQYYINPTGRFVVGGPQGDTGLTGRKIIVDTYGGKGSHGGGAFSGKDPTKVDRSGSYAVRWVAKNLVAAGLADECEVQIGYAIGVVDPVSVTVNTYGSGKIDDHKITKIVRKIFDLTPSGMMKALNLRRPIFRDTAAYGHFGRTEPTFTWERTDRVDEIKKAAGL
ncbi:MAG: methionine adenosyltransferase [Candidatus Cloacimonetes bacterium 4572_55]|nr:MAG: methionine adenosyltransferase [Candidatus Cloacimonetes bacterium 4572_55]